MQSCKYTKISERAMFKVWRKCLEDKKPYAGYFIYLMLQTPQVKKLDWNYAKLARNYHIKNFIMCEINYYFIELIIKRERRLKNAKQK